MENQNDRPPYRVRDGIDITGEMVTIERSAVNSVDGTTVTLRMAAARDVTADQLVVRQGALAKVKTENLEVTQGAVAYTQTTQASLNASRSGVVVAGNDIRVDQSSTNVMVAGGNVNIDQSATVIMVGNTIQTHNSPVFFLFAKNVEGDVKPTFGPQESIIFGAAAGMVAGVIMLIGSIFKRKKKH